MPRHTEVLEQDETSSALPSFKNAKERHDWFIDNARQQKFDLITRALNAEGARDQDGFLNFDLSSTSVQKARLAPCFSAADPALLLQLRFLGMVEGRDVHLDQDENPDRALAMNEQSVHDSEVNRTCALAVFKLRRIFFENEAIKNQYDEDEFIPLETAQEYSEYQKTKQDLDKFFSDKEALCQHLLNRLEERVHQKDFNDNVYFQLGSRFFRLDVDAVSKEIFEEKILKSKKTLEAFIRFTGESLHAFYHQRLGEDLKGHLEPRKNGEIGIVLKDKTIEGEVPNFYGTPEENLVLAWKMLHAEGARAPEGIQTENRDADKAKAQEAFIRDFLFHLAAVYCEYTSGSAACGQGTWVRILDFFNGKYHGKILKISPKTVSVSQITKEGIADHYSSYIATALQDKRFEPYLGALFFWNKNVPTALQQAFIGANKQAFASLYRDQFNELPEDYELLEKDWMRLDRFLSEPLSTETIQSEILKIANPFLTEKKTVILKRIQQNPEFYQSAFQELAFLMTQQESSVLHQISADVSGILQSIEDKDPQKNITSKCKALLKTLTMPLVAFILPPLLSEQLIALLKRAQNIPQKTKAFQAFLKEMEAIDKELTEQDRAKNNEHLTIDYPKPAPHPLFELMGKQHARVFWQDFVADAKIQKALLKQFPHVPLQGTPHNPYTTQRLKCYVFLQHTPKQKLDLTTKGLLPEKGRSILEKNKWDDATLLEHAAGGDYPEWLESLLNQYKHEIKRNQDIFFKKILKITFENNCLGVISCVLDFIMQEKMNLKALKLFRPLYDACRNNRVEVVRLLLEHKNMNAMIDDQEWGLALENACTLGCSEIVKLLLGTEKRDFTQFEISKSTRVKIILPDACAYGSVEFVKRLLAHPSVNINDRYLTSRKSLLTIAAEHGKTEIAEMLLEDSNIRFNLFYPAHNVPVRNKMWGNLKSIYEKQQTSGTEETYTPHQRKMQRTFALSEKGFSLCSVLSPLTGASPLLPWWVVQLLRPLKRPSFKLSYGVAMAVVLWGWLSREYPLHWKSNIEGVEGDDPFAPLIVMALLALILMCGFFAGTSVMLSATCYLICGMVCLFKGEPFESGLNLGLDLLLGPERIEKITLPEGKKFSDYQAWRRAVKRKLPKEASLNPDYEQVGDLYYRKKRGYVKKVQEKPDPFDYKEQDGRDVYLPSHKAGMLYLYTEQPNADEVRSDVFCAAKGNSSEFVKKLLKS